MPDNWKQWDAWYPVRALRPDGERKFVWGDIVMCRRSADGEWEYRLPTLEERAEDFEARIW